MGRPDPKKGPAKKIDWRFQNVDEVNFGLRMFFTIVFPAMLVAGLVAWRLAIGLADYGEGLLYLYSMGTMATAFLVAWAGVWWTRYALPAGQGKKPKIWLLGWLALLVATATTLMVNFDGRWPFAHSKAVAVVTFGDREENTPPREEMEKIVADAAGEFHDSYQIDIETKEWLWEYTSQPGVWMVDHQLRIAILTDERSPQLADAHLESFAQRIRAVLPTEVMKFSDITTAHAPYVSGIKDPPATHVWLYLLTGASGIVCALLGRGTGLICLSFIGSLYTALLFAPPLNYPEDGPKLISAAPPDPIPYEQEIDYSTPVAAMETLVFAIGKGDQELIDRSLTDRYRDHLKSAQRGSGPDRLRKHRGGRPIDVSRKNVDDAVRAESDLGPEAYDPEADVAEMQGMVLTADLKLMSLPTCFFLQIDGEWKLDSIKGDR